MTALAILTLILWFGIELAYHDLSLPKPRDPFRLARWKNAEGGARDDE